ncbi:hypothetical protein NMS_2573 [Nonlabens marinus S1-08]|uniref:Uncharacterized protein n=1 Tax=Nonlabens marinus S1-08 TaxID=1454201 RepID=W8VXV4_9FLAO|nr:hypothetical protein NMS_2573 [Nonlabens marinus S1-08]
MHVFYLFNFNARVHEVVLVRFRESEIFSSIQQLKDFYPIDY